MSKSLVDTLATSLHGEPDRLERIYVWELPVRLTHWAMVITLIALTITGTYMHHPFLTPLADSDWTMGLMRAIHFISAFLFTCSFIVRFAWFFTGNRWAGWRQFIPLYAHRRRGMLEMIRFYGFMRRNPPEMIGHNGLAGAAYCIVWAACIAEIFTGFALMDNFMHTSPSMHLLFGWLPRLIDIQWLRGIHFFVMFVFWFFFIHHLYSAVVVSGAEKSGIMESIFSGYKYLEEKDLVREELLEQEEESSRPEKR